MSIRATVISVLVALITALSFGVYYYHDAYSDTAKNLEAAERKQQQAETIAGKVIQSMRIFNAITRANHDEKQQIQQRSENTVVYLREQLSTDECAVRPVPDDVVSKLREHADRIRNGSRRADPRRTSTGLSSTGNSVSNALRQECRAE